MAVNEQQVKQYLREHPELWAQWVDDVDMQSSKVMDFRAAQLAKAEADKHQLNQRQAQWLATLNSNQQLAEKLWASAAYLARANGYQAMRQAVDDLLFRQLAFADYALKLMPPRNKRALPQDWVLAPALADMHNDIQMWAHLPQGVNTWLRREHESFIFLPLVWQEQTLGYWLIASDEADYFHQDMDTSYLQAYMAVLSASLARLMGVAN